MNGQKNENSCNTDSLRWNGRMLDVHHDKKHALSLRMSHLISTFNKHTQMAHVFGIWCESRADALIIRSMIAQVYMCKQQTRQHEKCEKNANKRMNEQVVKSVHTSQKIRHNVSKVKNSKKINSV